MIDDIARSSLKSRTNEQELTYEEKMMLYKKIKEGV